MRRLALALLLCLSGGCELTSAFLTRDVPQTSAYFDSFVWNSDSSDWWARYNEYFSRCRVRGCSREGRSCKFTFDGAQLREGRRNDLLRALRTDLVDKAANSGATVMRPIRESAAGFSFDYAQGRFKGTVKVSIVEVPGNMAKPPVDLSCTVEEATR